MDLCQEMMTSLSSSAVPLSGLTYCILIKGHGRAGNIRRVSQTYGRMRELEVCPPPSTLDTFDPRRGLGLEIGLEIGLDPQPEIGLDPQP